MKILFFILTSFFFISNSYGQNYEIVNHNYENFHDFPQDVSFAEDADGSIWVLGSGGFTGDVVSVYKDEVWESVPFDACGNCSYGINADNDGVIYLATNIGFFAYVDGNWVAKSGDVISNGEIDFDSEGNLWFTSNDDPKKLAFLDQSGVVTRIDAVQGDIRYMTVSDDDKVWFYNSSEIISYSSSAGIESYDESANFLSADGDNNMWFIDFQGTVGKIVGNNILTNQIPDASNNFQALSLAIDKKNDLLYMGQQGTNAGVMMANLAEGTNQFINSDGLFPDEIGLVNSLFVSSNGTVWAGSRFTPKIAEIQVDIVSSVIDEVIAFDVFPNPTSNLISINNTSESKIVLSVMSVSGITMDEIEVPLGKLSIDVSSYPEGLYLIGNSDIGFKKLQIIR